VVATGIRRSRVAFAALSRLCPAGQPQRRDGFTVPQGAGQSTPKALAPPRRAISKACVFSTIFQFLSQSPS
jgi:hypothetical protein